MPEPSSLAEAPSNREIVSTRLLPAASERVFDAFADATQLAQWWGPHGFTNTIREFDLRVGGRWRLTMHGPNGANYHNESQFTEVARPARIVFQHLEPVHGFQMTMLFETRHGQTQLTWRMLFESAAECARCKDFIGAANEQNFDRLAAHLAVPR